MSNVTRILLVLAALAVRWSVPARLRGTEPVGGRDTSVVDGTVSSSGLPTRPLMAPAPVEGSYTNLPPPPDWTPEEFVRLAANPVLDTIEGDVGLEKSRRISGHKNGFFQKLDFSVAWFNRSSDADLGLTEVQSCLTVALPAPTRDYPLLITPGFNMTAFNGPTRPDLPAQTYDAHLELMWLPKLSERWLGIVSVAPGVYSDFEKVDGDAVRVTARALGRYTWIPGRLDAVLGVLYLDRFDINWLPAGGLIWTPDDDSRYELIFPRPKLSRCITRSGLHEDWVYLAGEFGGDMWSFSTPAGVRDEMILRDWRLFLGVERKRDGGAGHRIEIGYVFSREVEFRSTAPDYHPGDTVMLRAAVTF